MIDQNTADTLNKALDLAKQGVVAAFETVKEYAPQVWAMARRQIILEGIELLCADAILILVFIFLIRTFWKHPVPLDHEDSGQKWNVANALVGTIISSIIFVIGFVALSINAADFLFNPDWWTMQSILALARR